MIHEIIKFIVMCIIGIFLNPMNMLLNDISDFYFSLTLFYGGLLMASNMIWSHEILHFMLMKHMNIQVFFIGIILSIVSITLLRSQFLVNDNQWLKRMISHHSTALTTSKKIFKKSENTNIKKISQQIIDIQNEEIKTMKSHLNF